MMIKVDSNEVERLTSKLEEYCLDLYSEIKGCITDLNDLKTSYDSPEGKYAMETTESYFDNLRVVPYTLNELNSSIKKANNMYDEQDEEFLKEIQKTEEEEKKLYEEMYN